jgi:cysteine desulfurase/selenocysteine lyase
LVAFNLAGRDPVSVAQELDRAGIEARAGCHCATLAHHSLGLDPPASCRLSFYLYNTPAEIDQAVAAVTAIATGRHRPRSPGTGGSPSRPGTARPVRRFASSHPAGVAKESAMPAGRTSARSAIRNHKRP